jgi:hypothetical protein
MDGTDLSLAYGDSYDMDSPGMSMGGNFNGNYKSKGSYKDPGLVIQKEPQRTVDLPLPKLSSSPLENPNYKVPQDIYANQGNDFEEKPKYSSRSSQLSFWDKIGNKKMEVLKVFILSLVIVLGISIDHISKHYLDNYISKSFLTETQEFLVRLSYPLIVILVIWIIKASF